jgi:hypothetical protein
MCGILDNLGNKLCIDNSENCPINYITLDKSNLHYTFNKTTIDNLTIYYTNEATETGKVVGGLFVDSDLLIKYNNEDCVTLATSTISSLLNSQNNKLYRNSLNFDPYKENIDLKGKSYLKWCVPGHGKEKSISKIRKLNDDYTYNISMNKDVIPYLKDFRFLIFGSLPGFIDEFLVILISCYLFYRKTNLNNENKKAFVERIIEKIFLYVMAFTIFILFIGLGLYFYDSTLSKLSIANKPEQNNPFKTIKTNYTVCIWLNIALIVFNCVLLCYNNCYLNKKNQNNSNNIKRTALFKPKSKTKTKPLNSIYSNATNTNTNNINKKSHKSSINNTNSINTNNNKNNENNKDININEKIYVDTNTNNTNSYSNINNKDLFFFILTFFLISIFSQFFIYFFKFIIAFTLIFFFFFICYFFHIPFMIFFNSFLFLFIN